MDHCMNKRSERALVDPSLVFEDPESVLRADLSRDQKLEILHGWEFDLRELAVAEEENMGGGEDSALLPRVRKALRALEHPDPPTGPATKHGP
jgi:hypothetical protein